MTDHSPSLQALPPPSPPLARFRFSPCSLTRPLPPTCRSLLQHSCTRTLLPSCLPPSSCAWLCVPCRQTHSRPPALQRSPCPHSTLLNSDHHLASQPSTPDQPTRVLVIVRQTTPPIPPPPPPSTPPTDPSATLISTPTSSLFLARRYSLTLSSNLYSPSHFIASPVHPSSR